MCTRIEVAGRWVVEFVFVDVGSMTNNHTLWNTI